MKFAIKFLFLAVGLSLLLSGFGLFVNADRQLLVLLYSLGPFFASLIFGGFKFLQRLFNFKAYYWVLIALVVPFLYLVMPNYMIGGTMNFNTAWILLIVFLISAFFEELAWRGFLFEKFKTIPLVKMNLIIGLMWALWHYPALLSGNYDLTHSLYLSISLFTLNVILLSFLFGFLMKRSGLIFVPVILHFVHNSIYRVFNVSPLLAEDGYLLTVSLLTLIVIGYSFSTPLKYQK